MSDKIIQDKTTILQVIGCLLKKPDLLLNGEYKLDKNDFPEKFHKMIYASISNLLSQGINEVDVIAIDNFLSSYPTQYKIFEKNNGIDYLDRAIQYANLNNFKYNYNRLKKFTILREYDSIGIYVGDIYDPLATEGITCEDMQENFDQMTIVDIINYVDSKQLRIKAEHLKGQGSYGQHASVGISKLVDNLKETPEIGVPLCSELLNYISRGARLKKLYLRSAGAGVGKSRMAVADACNIAIDEIYDIKNEKWAQHGSKQSTLFITTELDMDEIQTMILAFVSGVSEDHILDGVYEEGEEERIQYATEIIERSLLYIEHIPDFDISDIEQIIKQHVLSKNIKYVWFDYIQTTVKILQELSSKSKGMKLREDNVLLMFITKLKALCNELGIFMYTSTQLSGDFKNVKDADQSLLRGAKSLSDKIDLGIIAMVVTNSDLKALRPILAHQGIGHQPNMVYHVYKNRRGKLVRVKVWVYIDLSNLREYDLFITDQNYKIIPTTALEIIVSDDRELDDNLTSVIDE